MLVGLDGSKALGKAVLDHPVIQRCQLHYADLLIMPMPLVNPLQGSGFSFNRSA
jgi:hypothetical protein